MSRRIRPLTCSLAILATILAPALAAAVSSHDSLARAVATFHWDAEAQVHWAGTPRDIHQGEQQMQSLQKQLASRHADAALEHPVVVPLTAAERQQIDRAGRSEGKYLVGISKTVGIDVRLGAGRSLGARAKQVAGGMAVRSGQDGIVWTLALRSPGATALRLHVTGLDLPRGAALYVYNSAGQAFGPYAGRGPVGNGDLYTNTVFGDQIVLQLHADGGAAIKPFRIAEVGVMGKRFLAPKYGPHGAIDGLGLSTKASNLCAFNADCVVNAACTSSGAVNAAKEAVASILFASGGSYYICTGGLISTNGSSQPPYFLTAHHCINKSGEASSLETYFDYTTSCNSPNCTQPYNNTGDTVGSTILATGSSSDYSLLQLSATPVTADGQVAYLGWSSTDISNSTTGLYRISHPQGAPQAYSTQSVDPSKPTCRSLPRGSFLYSRDTLGATEGGSSGSPVVNGSGQIVGQLYGACGTNLNDVCDAANNATVDGAFAASYPNLTQWLDGSGGGGGGGGGGGCTLGAKGDVCTSNSDCCSNKCTGKPGHQSCK